MAKIEDLKNLVKGVCSLAGGKYMESKGVADSVTCEFKEGAYLSFGKDLASGKLFIALRGEGNRFFATGLDDLDMQISKGEIIVFAKKSDAKAHVIYTLRNIDVSLE